MNDFGSVTLSPPNPTQPNLTGLLSGIKIGGRKSIVYVCHLPLFIEMIKAG